MTVHDAPSNTLSLAGIFNLRGKAFAKIRRHSAAINAIATAIAYVDVAMQTAIAEHNIDDQQSLITHARQLAALLDCGVAK